MNEIEQRLKMKRAYLESVKQQAAEDARNSAPKIRKNSKFYYYAFYS